MNDPAPYLAADAQGVIRPSPEAPIAPSDSSACGEEQIPKLGDTVWDLALVAPGTAKTIRFDTIEDPLWRRFLQEYLALRSNPRAFGRHSRPKQVGTISTEFNVLRRLAVWATSESIRPSEIQPHHIEEFVDGLTDRTRSDTAAALESIWKARRYLKDAKDWSHPLGGRPAKVWAKQPERRRTEPIAFDEWLAVMSAAWWVVSDVGCALVDSKRFGDKAIGLTPIKAGAKPILADQAGTAASIVRGAAYVLLCGFTGARRGEVFAIDPDSIEVSDVLSGTVICATTRTKNKGNLGERLELVAPPQARLAIDVLYELGGEQNELFRGDSNRFPSAQSLVTQFLKYVVTDPAERNTYGNKENPIFDIPVSPDTGEAQVTVNQRRLRVTLASLARQHPATFAGLWLQYGHVEASMTNYYGRGGTELQTERMKATQDVLAKAITGDLRSSSSQDDGPNVFSPDLSWQPRSTEEFEATVREGAEDYHFGVNNDCFYRPTYAPAACRERPQVDSPACLRQECSNCVITELHRPAIEVQIIEIERRMGDSKLLPGARSKYRTQRSVLLEQLAQIGPQDSEDDE